MINMNATTQRARGFEKWFKSRARAARPQTIRLADNATYSLKGAAQTFWVTRGMAWVTFDGEDYVMRSGEMLRLPRTKHPIVVSNPGADELVFEVQLDPAQEPHPNLTPDH